MKKAIITGINGQDGYYLSQLLISKGYQVYGIERSWSKRSPLLSDKIIFITADMTDDVKMQSIIKYVQPDEFYNLAAQSNVKLSFVQPEYTTHVNALAVLSLLESIHKYSPKTKFYQASSSEMFGDVIGGTSQNEHTEFRPRSPYAASKCFAHHITKVYREAYNIFACSGILQNHESPLRGENFVTRKITKYVGSLPNNKPLELGNIHAKRDFGHAKDYVRAMWMMLQQDLPEDYVISTGQSHSVKEFCEEAFLCRGIQLEWRGNGLEEVGLDKNNGDTLIIINPEFYRPTDIDCLRGDSSKARELLKWEPQYTFSQLVREMVDHDTNQ